MSGPSSFRCLRLAPLRTASRTASRPLRLGASSCRNFTSSFTLRDEASPNPLIKRLRADLKSAMQSKDTPRLNVLRALLASITNASKTSSPIMSNAQLVPLLRKRLVAAQTAIGEFKDAKREDLVAKEEEQVHVLEEYANELGGETVGEDEIRRVAQEAVDKVRAQAGDGVKVNMGEVLKHIIGGGGVLEGKQVEKKDVVKAVQDLLKS